MAAGRRRREREVHQAYVYDPIDRVRRPFDPWARDEPIAIRMQWTDEALALLLLMREIVVTHIEQIRAHAPESEASKRFWPHLRLGLRTTNIIDALITAKPKLLVLEPTAFVDNTILLYLDSMVGVLREVGPAAAGQLLRNMGWRPRYAGSYYSPTRTGWAQPPQPPPWQQPMARGVYYSPTGHPGPGREVYSPMPTRDPRHRPVYHSPAGRSGAGHVYQSPENDLPKERLTFVSKRAK